MDKYPARAKKGIAHGFNAIALVAGVYGGVRGAKGLQPKCN
jgi:hypothetical protein